MEKAGLGVECALRGILYGKSVIRQLWPEGDFIKLNPDKKKEILYTNIASGLTWKWEPTFDDLYAEDYHRKE